MTSALFSPIRLAGLELANRIVVAPMCQYSADDGCANDWHLMHLGMLANSGAALVVVEATHVERHGRITHGCMGLYSDDNEVALGARHRALPPRRHRQVRHPDRARRPQGLVATALGRRQGAAGRAGSVADHCRFAAAVRGEGWHVPREATEADIERVREAFVASAKRALRIGFDEIELHMAHGYLLHGFMSPLSNKRTDQYGGSFENRMRFPLAVARAVRAAVPKTHPARRPHHRQRLARRRADARRRGGDCQGAQGRGTRFHLHLVGRRRSPTSAPRPSPATTWRLPRG